MVPQKVKKETGVVLVRAGELVSGLSSKPRGLPSTLQDSEPNNLSNNFFILCAVCVLNMCAYTCRYIGSTLCVCTCV